jgi:hypothetical protein
MGLRCVVSRQFDGWLVSEMKATFEQRRGVPTRYRPFEMVILDNISLTFDACCWLEPTSAGICV